MGSLGVGEQEGITDLRYDEVLSGSKGLYDQADGHYRSSGLMNTGKINFNKTIVLTTEKKRNDFTGGEVPSMKTIGGKTFLKPSTNQPDRHTMSVNNPSGRGFLTAKKSVMGGNMHQAKKPAMKSVTSSTILVPSSSNWK
mmetsp:Transcript_13259/g.20752  ORF Transcript_13259/g.20752 Transcript_13259/m.20752 type:complete len:140 (+) Transcript_13259:1383-1802(+)